MKNTTIFGSMLLGMTLSAQSSGTFQFAKEPAPATDTLVLLAAKDSLPSDAALQNAAQAEGFTGEKGESLLYLSAPAPYQNYQRVILFGAGDPSALTQADLPLLGAELERFLNNSTATQIAIDGRSLQGEFSQAELAAQVAFGMELAAYRFDQYKSDKAQPPHHQRTFLVDDTTAAQGRHAELLALANGVKLARDLTNQPPSNLPPAAFAEVALQLREQGVSVTVLEEDALRELGMEALLAVGRGSEHPPRLVVAHWQGSDEPAIAILGKGITFDTGGYNIKTSPEVLLRMPTDMGGAAAALGAISTLAAQKAPVNVVAILPLAENMVSGRAYLPGDVIRTASGTTVEVVNTDAEGRLVLADAMWYAKQHYKPRLMVDIATLSGAKAIALGNYYGGLFSHDDALAAALLDAGKQSGELLWRMPLTDAMLPELRSRIADLRNTGARNGAASIAALFLQQFAGDTPFAHIDIAGSVLNPKEQGLAPEGANGFGVQLLVQWLTDNSATTAEK